jgi:hypothetical protein
MEKSAEQQQAAKEKQTRNIRTGAAAAIVG